ncbi:hypothetical protein BP5796_07731 [Coleophoma crateriformis]|uniref:Peptidase A1 domain-containing protein n=1 Tax=Coleophoma crateriformis TaxID=565419 RepID=A0A3D8RCB5_9HELO|nr:hypothetical protein BP5796_07731 [Coleophoma crateriformis]
MIFITSLLLLLVSPGNSLDFLQSNVAETPGVLQLRVDAVKNTSMHITERSSALRKRTVLNDLANSRGGTLYMINLKIGTPPQTVTIQIDTGSSELWVNPTCSQAGNSNSIAVCNSLPVYSISSSSTGRHSGQGMQLYYGKGSCSGEYVIDTVNIGGANLPQTQFGMSSYSSSLAQGIMGISWGYGLTTDYYNILDQLTAQDYIASRTFSLDLGSVDTASGSLIFGGLDSKKYSGPLEKRPIIPYPSAPDGYPRYWIYMNSIGISPPGAYSKNYTSAGYKQPVFLDSGGTLSRLPADIVNMMLGDFPGAVSQGNGLFTIPCAVGAQSGTVDFGFGSTIIRVPYHQFIWTAGPNVCVLGAIATSGNSFVLGDTFLRAAYVVFDQDNGNLFVANGANCGSNVVAIGSGPDAVPSITGGCSGPAPLSISMSATPTSRSKTSSTSSKSSSSKKSSTSMTSSSKVTSSSAKTTSFKSSSSVKKTSPSSSIKATSTIRSTSSVKTTSSPVKTTSSVKITSPGSLAKTTSSSAKASSKSSVKNTLSVKTTSIVKSTSSSAKPSSNSSLKTSSTRKATSTSKSSSTRKATSTPKAVRRTWLLYRRE